MLVKKEPMSKEMKQDPTSTKDKLSGNSTAEEVKYEIKDGYLLFSHREKQCLYEIATSTIENLPNDVNFFNGTIELDRTVALSTLFKFYPNAILKEIRLAKPEGLPVSFRPIPFDIQPKFVQSFTEEGFHTTNFYTLRANSIAELRHDVDNYKSLLIASTPFTGKTSLSILLHNSLLSSNVKSCLIRLSDYEPKFQSLDDFILQCTGISLTALFDPTEVIYILFDEFQKTYPNTQKQVIDAYFYSDLQERIEIEKKEDMKYLETQRSKRSKPNENITVSTPEKRAFDYVCATYQLLIGKIAFQHGNLQSKLKTALSNKNFRLICFSSYGDQKVGSECSTPYTFGRKLTKYAYFSDDEMNELLADFTQRSQLFWFKKSEEILYLKQYLQERASFHIGFVSSILGHINYYPVQLASFTALCDYLISPKITHLISTKRATPSETEFNRLTVEEKAALIQLLQADKVSLNDSEFYLSFVKKGWLKLEDRQVSFPCSLSKDVFYFEFYGLNRPEEDKFTTLEAFMEEFLLQLPLSFFVNSLSVSKDKPNTFLEIFWCHELYRVGYSILRKDTYVHGQVQQVGNRQVQGKVDFVIKNGNRAWVIELLISGDEKLGKNTTTACEHLSRFNKNSKYSEFSSFDHLVVDFRPGSGARNEKVESPNYWLIYYDSNNNYRLDLLRLSRDKVSFQPV